jgi:hypothetical protein
MALIRRRAMSPAAVNIPSRSPDLTQRRNAKIPGAQVERITEIKMITITLTGPAGHHSYSTGRINV